MITLHDNVGPGRDPTGYPWICSWTRFQLSYGWFWGWFPCLADWLRTTTQTIDNETVLLHEEPKQLCYNFTEYNT